jgi:hypothetical protein
MLVRPVLVDYEAVAIFVGWEVATWEFIVLIHIVQ